MNKVIVRLTLQDRMSVQFSVDDPGGTMADALKKGITHIHIESETERPRTETLFNKWL